MSHVLGIGPRVQEFPYDCYTGLLVFYECTRDREMKRCRLFLILRVDVASLAACDALNYTRGPI